jgi:CheY-like chemotaxis protein
MSETQTKTFSVLLVDADRRSRETTRKSLENAWTSSHALAIEHAEDGGDALNKLSTRTFMLVVLDWKSPAFDGGELLRNMRYYGIRAPVMVISSLQRGDIATDLESLGAVHLNRHMITATTLKDSISSSLRLLARDQSNPAGVARIFPIRSKPPKPTAPPGVPRAGGSDATVPRRTDRQ